MSIAIIASKGILVTQNGHLYEFKTLLHSVCAKRLYQVPSVANVAIGGYGNDPKGNHFAAACINGTIWTWGSNKYGQTAQQSAQESTMHNPHHTLVDIHSPEQLSTDWFGGMRVVSVACGYETTFAVTETGRVYAFGSGCYGKLGLGPDSQERIYGVPTLIDGLADVHVAMIATNGSHSLCVSTEGRVWSWGRNIYKQLGIEGVGEDYVTTPTPVTALDKYARVVFAATSPFNSIVVTVDGEVVAWGGNKNGQCGFFETSKLHTPTLVPFTRVVRAIDRKVAKHAKQAEPTPVRIKMVECKDDQTIAMDEGGVLWWSGRASSLEIWGMQSFSTRFMPMPLQSNENMDIAAVCIGNHKTITLSHDGVLGWIYPTRSEFYINNLVNSNIFDGNLVGVYARIPKSIKLAFAMGTHDYLGGNCSFFNMDPDLMQTLFAISDANPIVIHTTPMRTLCGGWEASKNSL